MNILLVGVGLIGGSYALALKEEKEFVFGGYDISKENLSEAKNKGIISHAFSLNEGLKWADMILLSIPVDKIREVLPQILDQIGDRTFVVDFGSTKSTICTEVDQHARRSKFIAAHPIAGTEHSGPGAAFESLYQGKNLIICDQEKSDPAIMDLFLSVSEKVGFYFTYMSAAEHDRHLAYISHLSHISSYVLSNTVLEKERDGEVILELAGSGFESTVRLAKSSPKMWSSIFRENREMVLKGIIAYKEELQKLENFIQQDDDEAIKQYLEDGRSIRKILK